MPDTHSLNDIIAFFARYLPALQGSVRPSETPVCACTDDKHEDAQMAEIFASLADAYPEAGSIYWGCRTWQLWMWQPVFLGVWAASVQRVCIDFESFTHQMGDLFTEPYTLPEQTLRILAREEAIVQTASGLQNRLTRELGRIRPHYLMTDKLASYFLGDAVLKALAAGHRIGILSKADVPDLAQIWQSALPLPRHGRLVWQEEAQEYLVELTACCQHYRRNGADYCTGCPKTRRKPPEAV